VHGDCEWLFAKTFIAKLGINPGATAFLIDQQLFGKGARITARVLLTGRIEREIDLIKSTARNSPGFWRLPLTSPGIDAARARGPVVVIVTVRATAPGRDVVWRARLRLRLERMH
jgi:hypothetical protein